MPRPALTEDQRREIRRKIRAAAAELYASGGANGVSARAVAERAGISVGTVYSHFGNLSELLQSLWRRPAARLIVELEQISQTRTSPRIRMRKLLAAYVEFAENNPSVFRNAFLFVRSENQKPPPRVALDDDRFFTLFRNTVLLGQAEGQFREDDPDLLTQTVLAAVHGSLSLPINLHRLALDTSKAPPQMMIDAMLEWLSVN